jgi:hypothetical protein
MPLFGKTLESRTGAFINTRVASLPRSLTRRALSACLKFILDPQRDYRHYRLGRSITDIMDHSRRPSCYAFRWSKTKAKTLGNASRSFTLPRSWLSGETMDP